MKRLTPGTSTHPSRTFSTTSTACLMHVPIETICQLPHHHSTLAFNTRENLARQAHRSLQNNGHQVYLMFSKRYTAIPRMQHLRHYSMRFRLQITRARRQRCTAILPWVSCPASICLSEARIWYRQRTPCHMAQVRLRVWVVPHLQIQRVRICSTFQPA